MSTSGGDEDYEEQQEQEEERGRGPPAVCKYRPVRVKLYRA